MAAIEISALGIGALRIGYGDRAIYVDSFIEYGRHPLRHFEYGDASAIVITHDHGDHFSPVEVAAAARKTGALVVGPPSVAYPLLAEQGLAGDRVRIPYDQDPGAPVAVEIEGARISSFASRHFHDGDNLTIHNSYLIEVGGKKIYLTGDSDEITRKDERLRELDALVVNFVVFEQGIAKAAILEDFREDFSPGIIAPIHMIDCDWTASPAELKAEVARRGIEGVVVLDDPSRSLAI